MALGVEGEEGMALDFAWQLDRSLASDELAVHSCIL